MSEAAAVTYREGACCVDILSRTFPIHVLQCITRLSAVVSHVAELGSRRKVSEIFCKCVTRCIASGVIRMHGVAVCWTSVPCFCCWRLYILWWMGCSICFVQEALINTLLELLEQDAQCPCYVTIVAVDRQYVLRIYVCVCSLSCPAIKAHAPYFHLWPVWLQFRFGKRLLNKNCVFWFSLPLLPVK